MYPNVRKLMGDKPLGVTCSECNHEFDILFRQLLDADPVKCPHCEAVTHYEMEAETHDMLKEMEEDLSMIANFANN